MDKNKQKLSPETIKAADQASDFDASIDSSLHTPPPRINLSDLADQPVDSAFEPISEIANGSTGGSAGSTDDGNGMASSGVSASAGPAPAGWRESLRPYARKRSVRIGLAVSGLSLIVVIGVAIGLFLLAKRPQLISNSSQLDQSTLYIDSTKKAVGIKVDKNPSGLEVASTVSDQNQGTANVRMGLVNGTDPSLFFEDAQANSWQLLGSGGSLQFIQGGQTQAKLDKDALTLSKSLNVNGNTTLGDKPDDVLTIQGANIAIPNNLSFANNALYIGNDGTVAVGAASSGGYKLLVAGRLKVNGSIYTDGQVLAAAGSAKNPSFTFTGDPDTGFYQAGLNVVGISAGGAQVVQIQQGILLTVNGANIEASGYLRGGRAANNPAFQIARFTGTLDGSGAATVSDGLATGYNRVLLAQAFYAGSGGVAVTLNVDYVNSGNFHISGGVPGAAFRASLIYSQDSAGW